MITRLTSGHVPAPARGLACSHRELRQAVAALRTAASSTTCPPAGHAFWSLLGRAATDLEAAVARHLDHERQHLPATLRMEHTALVVQAVGLSAQVQLTTQGDERAWPALRQACLRVIASVERHLEHEDALLPRIGRIEPYSPSIA
ncbi:MAG: hypothetical protein JWM80_5895 [Cyanobacteria bacterium RYN_339]|nr:hypothetical protein [Cyanobacteria bacterium RYN_339]